MTKRFNWNWYLLIVNVTNTNSRKSVYNSRNADTVNVLISETNTK